MSLPVLSEMIICGNKGWDLSNKIDEIFFVQRFLYRTSKQSKEKLEIFVALLITLSIFVLSLSVMLPPKQTMQKVKTLCMMEE